MLPLSIKKDSDFFVCDKRFFWSWFHALFFFSAITTTLIMFCRDNWISLPSGVRLSKKFETQIKIEFYLHAIAGKLIRLNVKNKQLKTSEIFTCSIFPSSFRDWILIGKLFFISPVNSGTRFPSLNVFSFQEVEKGEWEIHWIRKFISLGKQFSFSLLFCSSVFFERGSKITSLWIPANIIGK